MTPTLGDLKAAWLRGDHVEWSRLWGQLADEDRAIWEEAHGC